MSFLTIIKATRLYRIIPVLMVMTVSMAFANMIIKEIILLGFCCALVYAIIGIHNAIKDHDYQLPKYSKIVIVILLLGALLISLSHYIIFLTAITWILLGFIYNTIARHILFGDTTILAITHFALPSFSSSFLVGLDLILALELSILFLLIAWFITQAKNLKDTKKDKKMNYVTITTKFRKGVLLTKVFAFIPLVFMISSYFLFNFAPKFISILLIIVILTIIAVIKINRNQEKQSIGLLRLVFLVYMLGLIIDRTSNYYIIMLGLFWVLLYILYLLMSQLYKIIAKNAI